MTGSIDHGPVLTDEEYQRRVVALYTNPSALPSKELDARIRRAELDLMIDHRLGCRFPKERREALWEVQQRVERKRLRLALSTVARALLYRGRHQGARRLAGFAVSEYAKVLDSDELHRFLDDDDRGQPARSMQQYP